MPGEADGHEPPAESPGDALRDLYATLRAIAQDHMRRERDNHTLQATAVVHEAYLRLADVNESIWGDREHFLSVAAGTIRRVLVDHARAHNRDKRGGGERPLTIHSGIASSIERAADPIDVIALDEALSRLAQDSAESARLVELRFFAGFSIEQAADILGIGRNTAVRRWRVARAWLKRELSDQTNPTNQADTTGDGPPGGATHA